MISYCAQGCILEFQTMLPKGVFIFFARKMHFPFSECPMSFFCEGIYLLQNCTKWIFQNTRTYVMHNWPNGWVSKVLIHLWWKRQISAISVGSGSNLNYCCLIICYLFFQKIISRYKSIYLIRETPKKLKIQPLDRNGYSRRFDRILKWA